MFLCIRSDKPIVKMTVTSYAEASRAVRSFIEKHDLTAGCSNTGNSFHLATLMSDDKSEKLATVTYNGRVWSCKDGSEIKE